jgi:4-hydroxybenzoate polyprenyltransferase
MTTLHRRRFQILRAYVKLVHPVPIVFVLLATVAFGIVAMWDDVQSETLLKLVVAMLGAQLVIGSANELVDQELDAVAKPDKPLVTGLVSSRGARGVIAVGALLICFSWFTLSAWSFALLLIGTALGVAYSLWFKRSALGWLPYALALPLLPIWVYTATGNFTWNLLILYPLGALPAFSVHIAQSIPDIEGDRATSVANLTSRLGVQKSLIVCWAAAAIGPLIAVILGPALLDSPWPVVVASAIGILCVLLNVGLWFTNPENAVRACFPCIAAAAIITGVGWIIAT